MSHILVLYGTSEGQTAKIAREIGARLNAAGAEADVIRAGTADPKPAHYDGIIVAASVHAGGYQRAVARWIRAHRSECGTRPTAFVSVCLAIRSTRARDREDASAIPHRFLDQAGWHPQLVKIFAGALPYTRYRFVTRWIMKRIVAAAGGDTDTSRDYEYTDWNEVRDFADRFAHLVAKSQWAA